jgi:circadian clock protein KaiB
MATPGAPKPRLVLRLYVAGTAPNSIRAIANARAICDQHFAARHTLEIVDLLVEPGRALADGIIVTPTLLKASPSPVQRLVGNLNDLEQVVRTLEAR